MENSNPNTHATVIAEQVILLIKTDNIKSIKTYAGTIS